MIRFNDHGLVGIPMTGTRSACTALWMATGLHPLLDGGMHGPRTGRDRVAYVRREEEDWLESFHHWINSRGSRALLGNSTLVVMTASARSLRLDEFIIHGRQEDFQKRLMVEMGIRPGLDHEIGFGDGIADGLADWFQLAKDQREAFVHAMNAAKHYPRGDAP